jgi:hypothetical protein
MLNSVLKTLQYKQIYKIKLAMLFQKKTACLKSKWNKKTENHFSVSFTHYA